MKKIISLLFVFAALCGCAKSYTPILNTSFKANAVYKIGDFSFMCEISKNENEVVVTPTSTNAKGMSITYNGKIVAFNYKEYKKSFEENLINSTNPAKLIYDAFAYLESNDNVDIKKVDDTFQYCGKTSIGDFILIQNSDNSLKSLSIPTAEIYIEFED